MFKWIYLNNKLVNAMQSLIKRKMRNFSTVCKSEGIKDSFYGAKSLG